jgi:hypothetical protein
MRGVITGTDIGGERGVRQEWTYSLLGITHRDVSNKDSSNVNIAFKSSLSSYLLSHSNIIRKAMSFLNFIDKKTED